MKESTRDSPLVIALYFLSFFGSAGALTFLLVFVAAERKELFFAWLAILLTAPVVWLVIRWLNRRDDPRLVKRPPDTPESGVRVT